MFPIISVVGEQNSGKTTLIEKIIPQLKKRGWRVGTIKHDAHQFQIDHKGKDSYRMSKAGADRVVIVSDEKIAMIQTTNNKKQAMNLDDLSKWLFADTDIVITEGYKRENKPKIEVTRSGKLLCTKDDNLWAVVINETRKGKVKKQSFHLNVPCFDLDDTEEIVDLIEKKSGLDIIGKSIARE